MLFLRRGAKHGFVIRNGRISIVSLNVAQSLFSHLIFLNTKYVKYYTAARENPVVTDSPRVRGGIALTSSITVKHVALLQ